MCGIVTYVGPKQAYPILIKGLKRLEYRGYDSAGVALLIEWQRQAQKHNKSVCFINIPSQMLAIARLSGVDDLLSLKT